MAHVNARTTGAALNDLHRGLLLMSYIQHATRTSSQSHDEADGTLGPRPEWHELVDSICVLCDFEQAADAFVALAVEQDPKKTCFWIALNGAVPGGSTTKINASKEHLARVLKLIKRATNTGAQSRTQLIDEISDKSVRQSRSKVHNYHGRLASVTASAETQHKGRPVVSDGE